MKPPKTVTDTTVFVISPDVNAVVQRDYEGGAFLFHTDSARTIISPMTPE
jgi:hypothetical protein